jgi:hypothetical protein
MESKKMMKKELAFMKKKGAPKSMIKHEKAEAKGMNKGGKTSCYAKGGVVKKMAMGGAPGGMAPPRGPESIGGGGIGMQPTPREIADSRRLMQRINSSPQQETRGMRGARGYATGGTVKVPPKPYVPTAGDLNEKAGGDQEMENRSQTRGPGRGPMSRNAMKPKAYAAGGMVKADGCAVKGKTKGRFI